MSAAILETMRSALDASAQELSNARADFNEANLRFQCAEKEHSKLKAAVAALNGEAVPEPETVNSELTISTEAKPEPEEIPEGFVKGPEGELIDCRDIPPPPNDMKPRNDPNNPYAALKCAGCGRYGNISQRGVVRKGKQMIVTMCKCGNEIY